MHKPKIIVCATAYHPFVGGAEIAIREVAERLAGRLDFYVLTARMSRALPHREVRPEATVIRLGFGNRFDKWLLPFVIPSYLFWNLEFVPDSIGDWNFKKPSGFLLWGIDIGQGALGAAIAKCLYPTIPFVLTVQYGESPEHLRRGRWGLIARGFRFMLGRADRLTAISSYLLALAREHDYCGPADVIPNGVDAVKFQNTNDRLQTKHEVKNTKQGKTIITISRLVAKNGIDILIDAMAEVKKTAPDTRCVIIGDGPEKSNLKFQISNLGLERTVRLLGGIAHEDVPGYLRAADVFVRPSRSEGMGSAFVEAMAAGVPVIGTPVGGIPDVIEDGKTGLLARPEDSRDLAEKVLRVLADPRLAADLAAAGQEKAVRDFGWESIARAYAAVFQQQTAAKRRVVIATGLFPPEIGGPATYSKTLVDFLPQHGVGLRIVPFRAVRHFPKVVRHFIYFWKIVFAGRGSDVIFAQDPVSTGLPAVCAARLMRKKFLLKVVGDYAWEQYRLKVQSSKFKVQNEGATLEEFQKETYDLLTEVRRAVQRFVARRAVRIIVPSEYLKGIVAQWGVAREKITVIYNAFAPPGTPRSKTDARAALGVSPDTFQIVSAGRLVSWKGFRELIGALAVIQREIPKARLVIVGSGPDENALRKNIAEGKMGDIVSLAGGMSHEETLWYLRAADLFVLNSSYEGFSHTILEALAMKSPVMASDAGGNKEIITDGVNGRLYHRRDAEALAEEIVYLYRDPQARGRFAQEGKASLERFSRDAMVTRTAEVLIEL